jgi:Xaa-Pro aminopeptidase
MPTFPREETDSRIWRFQESLAKNGFDAALIVQHADLYYFSGTAQDAHLLVPSQGEPLLLVKKSLERAKQDCSLSRISPINGMSDLKETVNSHCGKLGRLGMELDVLPVNKYLRYRELFPESEITDVSPLIRRIRMVKSAHELELMGKAAVMNLALYEKVSEFLEEGISELEFAGRLEAYYRTLCHQGLVRLRSFNQEVFYGHVMSGANLAVPSSTVGPTGGPGANASLPQGAGTKIIERNEPVQVDYVGVYRGYQVDQARTFYLGRPPDRLAKVHEIALEIQQAVAEKGVPGARAEDLYELALRMADKAGLSEGFMGHAAPVSFVGHGVGIELDEFPVLGRRSPHILEEGMTIAVEPKFIFPGEGLAGIENTFAVTNNGMEKITLFDDAIQIV